MLPPYTPPSAQRAAVAAGAAPLLVLLAFVLIVLRLIDASTGLASFAACTVWVVYELSDFQRRTDRFNADYAARHLAWRSADSLRALATAAQTPAATREFVLAYVDAGRVLLRDGQVQRLL